MTVTVKAIKRVVREAEELTGNIATGQTIIRVGIRCSESPLARLTKAGRLNVWEQTAADEILHAHAISAGIGSTRDPDLGIGGAFRVDAADDMAARRIDTLDKFREWQSELKQTDALMAVTSILLEEMSLRDAEREHRWRNGTAFRHFRDGLRHFAALRGNVPRGEKWRLPVGKGSSRG